MRNYNPYNYPGSQTDFPTAPYLSQNLARKSPPTKDFSPGYLPLSGGGTMGQNYMARGRSPKPLMAVGEAMRYGKLVNDEDPLPPTINFPAPRPKWKPEQLNFEGGGNPFAEKAKAVGLSDYQSKPSGNLQKLQANMLRGEVK